MRIRGPVQNQFGGEGISHQKLNVYLGGGAGARQPALPGTNADIASAWTTAVVGDGRYDQAGVYAPAGTKVADGTILTVPETRQIAVVVPRSALGAVDLATARYAVAMLGNAEEGEGIGFIRPVYDYDYWNNPPAGMGWVKEFRFGGGAGQIDFSLPSKDTDTRDPNTIDVIVGSWPVAGPSARLDDFVAGPAADGATRPLAGRSLGSEPRRRHTPMRRPSSRATPRGRPRSACGGRAATASVHPRGEAVAVGRQS